MISIVISSFSKTDGFVGYIYKNLPYSIARGKEDLQNKTDMIFSWLLALVGTYVSSYLRAKSCASELKTKN